MRAPESCILPLLLLAGLLVASTEGYSVKGALQTLVPQQGVVQGWPVNSKESTYIEDDNSGDPDFVPEYDDVHDDSQYDDNDGVSYEDGSGGYSEEGDSASQDGGGSFIASEETEEGKLWLSDEDPDWTPSASQEDDEDPDWTPSQSQEDDEDPDWTPSQSQDQSYDDNSSQDVQSQEDDPAPGGFPPFPGITSHPDDVIAEYGAGDSHVDDGSAWQQDTQESYPAKGKRNVKRSYQVSQQVVQEPQQVVQVSAPYGNEQGKADSGTTGLIQESQGGYPGVSIGVEAVNPVGGPQLHEVGAGVEPEQGGAFGDKDKESSGSSIGGWFRQGWKEFTGAVEDLGDRAEESFRSLGDKVEHAAGHVHETVSAAVDKLHQAYDSVREKLPQILERFKALILKFGAVIQEGARYCLQRFEHTFDKVRESHVIVKLEKELQEGHAEVAKFFQILGEKVQAWRVQHSSGDVDAGLLDVGEQVHGQIEQEGPHRQDFEDMPDFFQDDQVIVQLNKLKEVGVLTDDDIIILTQEHVVQDQQNQHDQTVISQQEQSQNSDSQQQNQQQNYYNQQQSQSTGQAIQFPH